MKKLLSAVFTLLLLGACSKSEPVSLNGKEYMLINAPSNAYITISFDETGTKISGQAPVNRYIGGYQINGENIVITPTGVTMMAGPQELMEAETSYLQLLPTIKTFKAEGKKLTLINDANEELYFEEVEPQAPMTAEEQAPSADVLTGEAVEEEEIEAVPAPQASQPAVPENQPAAPAAPAAQAE